MPYWYNGSQTRFTTTESNDSLRAGGGLVFGPGTEVWAFSAYRDGKWACVCVVPPGKVYALEYPKSWHRCEGCPEPGMPACPAASTAPAEKRYRLVVVPGPKGAYTTLQEY